MARPWRIRYAGAKYHVTVRGNGRREVFHEYHDYARFMDQLIDALEKDRVVLYAYVLLSNPLPSFSGNTTRQHSAVYAAVEYSLQYVSPI